MNWGLFLNIKSVYFFDLMISFTPVYPCLISTTAILLL